MASISLTDFAIFSIRTKDHLLKFDRIKLFSKASLFLDLKKMFEMYKCIKLIRSRFANFVNK